MSLFQMKLSLDVGNDDEIILSNFGRNSQAVAGRKKARSE